MVQHFRAFYDVVSLVQNIEPHDVRLGKPNVLDVQFLGFSLRERQARPTQIDREHVRIPVADCRNDRLLAGSAPCDQHLWRGARLQHARVVVPR
jgi:hypothetical protein